LGQDPHKKALTRAVGVEGVVDVDPANVELVYMLLEVDVVGRPSESNEDEEVDASKAVRQPSMAEKGVAGPEAEGSIAEFREVVWRRLSASLDVLMEGMVKRRLLPFAFVDGTVVGDGIGRGPI
jgi:hypothetical protein